MVTGSTDNQDYRYSPLFSHCLKRAMRVGKWGDLKMKKIKGALIILWRKGIAVAECSRTSFLKKIAVRPGSFKPERAPICCVYQNPVGFDVTVARRTPRTDEWMVSIVRGKQGALSQKPDHASRLLVAYFLKSTTQIVGKASTI